MGDTGKESEPGQNLVLLAAGIGAGTAFGEAVL